MPYIVESPTTADFYRAVPDDDEQWDVISQGAETVIIPCGMSYEADEAYERVCALGNYKVAGMVGISPDGTLVLWSTPNKSHQDRNALLNAAAMLMHMEPAAARRAKSEAVVGWLDGLFSLQDTRTEGGSHAEEI